MLGDLFNKAKRYSEAIAIARKGLEVDPLNAGSYCVWGKALEKMERYEEAIDRFQKAVNCHDPNWTPYAKKEIERQQRLIEIRELKKQQEELEEE